jgi:transcriptional regulator with XRE-family HTH domain
MIKFSQKEGNSVESFGNKLKKARERKGFSQTEVYRRTKINNKTLSRYEKDGSEPDFETVKILAELYEVKVDDLIGSNTKESSIEETEMERMKREIAEITYKAKNEEDVRSILRIVEKALKE